MNKKIKLTMIICFIFIASITMIIFKDNLEIIEPPKQGYGTIDMDKAIAGHKAKWELIHERTNIHTTPRTLNWAMNQTNNDFDKAMELINKTNAERLLRSNP